MRRFRTAACVCLALAASLVTPAALAAQTDGDGAAGDALTRLAVEFLSRFESETDRARLGLPANLREALAQDDLVTFLGNAQRLDMLAPVLARQLDALRRAADEAAAAPRANTALFMTATVFGAWANQGKSLSGALAPGLLPELALFAKPATVALFLSNAEAFLRGNPDRNPFGGASPLAELDRVRFVTRFADENKCPFAERRELALFAALDAATVGRYVRAQLVANDGKRLALFFRFYLAWLSGRGAGDELAELLVILLRHELAAGPRAAGLYAEVVAAVSAARPSLDALNTYRLRLLSEKPACVAYAIANARFHEAYVAFFRALDGPALTALLVLDLAAGAPLGGDYLAFRKVKNLALEPVVGAVALHTAFALALVRDSWPKADNGFKDELVNADGRYRDLAALYGNAELAPWRAHLPFCIERWPGFFTLEGRAGAFPAGYDSAAAPRFEAVVRLYEVVRRTMGARAVAGDGFPAFVHAHAYDAPVTDRAAFAASLDASFVLRYQRDPRREDFLLLFAAFAATRPNENRAYLRALGDAGHASLNRFLPVVGDADAFLALLGRDEGRVLFTDKVGVQVLFFLAKSDDYGALARHAPAGSALARKLEKLKAWKNNPAAAALAPSRAVLLEYVLAMYDGEAELAAPAVSPFALEPALDLLAAAVLLYDPEGFAAVEPRQRYVYKLARAVYDCARKNRAQVRAVAAFRDLAAQRYKGAVTTELLDRCFAAAPEIRDAFDALITVR